MNTRGLKRGDMVRVLPHHIPGYEWTVDKVGSILCASHTENFDNLHNPGKRPPPPIKVGWWTVSIDHPYAQGGYAFAALPEEHLAPHACTDRCGVHLSAQVTG